MKRFNTKITGKTISDQRAAIITSAANLGPAIHDFLVTVLIHAAPVEAGGNGSGDVSAFDNLLKDMHKSQRTASLKAWVETHSPIRWRPEGRAHIVKGYATQAEYWTIQAGIDNPFYVKGEAPIKPYGAVDYEKMIQRDIDKLVEAVKRLAEGDDNAFTDDAFDYAAQSRDLGQMQVSLGLKKTAPDLSDVAAILNPGNLH